MNVELEHVWKIFTLRRSVLRSLARRFFGHERTSTRTWMHQVDAVRDASMHVVDGELMVLVGPSGSGKTTLLRLIAGLEKVSSGAIRIGSRRVTNLPPHRRNVAMVFQNYALYPHMSVYGNLTFGLRMRGVPAAEIRRRVDRVATVLQIGAFLHRYPETLSGGERQRVALGRAWAADVDVLLLDEPFSQLDPHLRREARAELKRLQSQLGTTTLHVTHDQAEALELGHRIAVVYGGQIQQCGTPRAIYEQPANRFVAEFFGSPPINLIDGHVQRSSDGCWFSGPQLRLRLPIPIQQLPVESAWQATLGIRPESIQLVPPRHDSPPPADVLVGQIELVEYLGAQWHVWVHVSPECRIAVSCPTFAFQRGDRIGLQLDPHRIHLFTPDRVSEQGVIEFGRNLLVPAEA